MIIEMTFNRVVRIHLAKTITDLGSIFCLPNLFARVDFFKFK